MYYVLMCHDKPNSEALRLSKRAQHLQYIQDNFGDKIVYAGPLLCDDGEHFCGSCYIFNVQERQEVEHFVANDPYNKASLFDSIVMHRWNPIIKNGTV